MDIAQVTQTDVLDCIRNRLLDKCGPLFYQDNVYFDDEPVPREAPPFDVCCSLAMSDGNFGTQGNNNLQQPPCLAMEHGYLYVTPMVKEGSDKPKQITDAILYDKRRGILCELKPRIMSALLTEQTGGVKYPWEPRMSDGTYILADKIKISGAGKPIKLTEHPFVACTLTFSISWVWKL